MPDSVQTVSKRTWNGVVRFLFFFVVVSCAALAALFIVGNQPLSSNDNALSKVVRVQPGMNTRQIAELLEEEGIISNPALFQIMVRLESAEHHLQAGAYLLSPEMRPLEIIDHLRSGRVTTVRVIIPEGFEIKQIAALLAEKGLADRERFIELASDAHSVFGEELPIDLPIASLEGYLFPDTYYFSEGQTEEDLIGQMVSRFVQVAEEEVVPLLEESGLTLHEVVTLASIVEREIMVHEERAIVASVYLNRLAVDMPLQADPTVRYVTEEERPIVLYRDLEIDSPYNTYRYRGLPPGPIASPGLASMLAVLNPAETNYFFFVSRRDGTHEFTETYSEHLKARRALGY
ncbi:MAG TPA: endolytic transglycosylase MltG [Firmicutes bacterium]|jgi:UPF0755 protein|nr:endolytic transglycosylase MltG [Bacillota bacterium]